MISSNETNTKLMICLKFLILIIILTTKSECIKTRTTDALSKFSLKDNKETNKQPIILHYKKVHNYFSSSDPDDFILSTYSFIIRQFHVFHKLRRKTLHSLHILL